MIVLARSFVAAFILMAILLALLVAFFAVPRLLSSGDIGGPVRLGLAVHSAAS